MKRKVRLKITTDCRQTVRYFGRRLSAPCAACGREVEMVTEGEAAAILRVGAETFERLAGAGRIHTVETVSGHFWVCKDSLFLT
jgi:hypothetical protein